MVVELSSTDPRRVSSVSFSTTLSTLMEKDSSVDASSTSEDEATPRLPLNQLCPSAVAVERRRWSHNDGTPLVASQYTCELAANAAEGPPALPEPEEERRIADDPSDAATQHLLEESRKAQSAIQGLLVELEDLEWRASHGVDLHREIELLFLKLQGVEHEALRWNESMCVVIVTRAIRAHCLDRLKGTSAEKRKTDGGKWERKGGAGTACRTANRYYTEDKGTGTRKEATQAVCVTVCHRLATCTTGISGNNKNAAAGRPRRSRVGRRGEG